MNHAYSQRQPVPTDLLGHLTEASKLIDQPQALRSCFQEHGYVLLRNVLDRDEVLQARCSIFSRLAEVGEIAVPVADGMATGTSRRRESGFDLGAFWKTVSQDSCLRAVTHGA